MESKNTIKILEEKQELLDFSLFSAIARNNAKDVVGLLTEGANINAVCPPELDLVIANPCLLIPSDILGFTVAICKRPYEIIKVLVENGLDINNINGENALSTLISNGDKETTEFFIKNGININAECSYGTYLIAAIEENMIEIAKMLIENGADVNAKTDEGKTALMIAVNKGNLEIVKLLLANNADATTKDNEGKTAIDYAQLPENTELIVDIKLLKHYGEIRQFFWEKYRQDIR